MQCKTGAEHLRSLQDGRTVYLDGKLVGDVTTHPAYRNAVGSAALLYDYQARPENVELMTFMPEGGTRRVNRCWQMPRSYDDLVQRRKALQAWAAVSCGFMGRSPDHLASSVIGQREGVAVAAEREADRQDDKRADSREHREDRRGFERRVPGRRIVPRHLLHKVHTQHRNREARRHPADSL